MPPVSRAPTEWNRFVSDCKGQGLSRQDISKLFRAREKPPVRPKIVKKRISVWWPAMQQWYSGTLGPLTTRGHHIAYDDGQRKYLNLEQETWTELDEETTTGQPFAHGTDIVSALSDLRSGVGQTASSGTANLRPRNVGESVVAPASESDSFVTIASFFVGIFRRNLMSCARMEELVRHLVKHEEHGNICKFVNCLCDDEHAIPVEALAKVIHICAE